MFFKQLHRKLLFLTRNKTRQKQKSVTTPRIILDKGESESLALEKVGKLIQEGNYKQGLNLVNTTIDNGITSQQLLAKKAYLLSQNKQYDEAHAIWDKLIKNKNKPKLAESAKQSLKISKIEQGESLAALKKDNEARRIWGDLCLSETKSIAKKACRLISKSLSEKALQISSTKSPKEAITFFIRAHLRLNLAPTLNKTVITILEQLDSSKTDLSNPDLKKHQLQLMFNTEVIECLEARLQNKGRLSAITPTQKFGSNRKKNQKED